MERFRNQLLEAMRNHNIPLSTGSCSEIYLEKAFDCFRSRLSALLVASELTQTSLMLPCDPSYTISDMSEMGEVLVAQIKALQAYSTAPTTEGRAA